MKQALADALEERGYTRLTPVQEAVTSSDLDGADLLVSAQTGSGKTLGFGLAIASNLLRADETFAVAGKPLALIIAPTRELALQVKRELTWLYAKAGATVASCVGGMDMRDERRALDRGAHIVVATPGRLRDHITRGTIDLGEIRAVVLDEADEMLDLGFREDLEFILGEAPEHRQTLLFSATVPASIEQLARRYQKDAVRVVTRSEAAQHADIEYRAMLVAERDAENAVINTLRFHEAPNAIVFCNTRDMVNRLTTRLSNRGFQVVALSGELSQTERSHALQAMRDGRARVCVATDVAARGIDLPNLDLVVHAQLPSNHETLLHRSGRTGRAGRKGVSALVVQPKFRKKAERLLGAAKIKADWGAAPSAEAVMARDETRMLEDPIWKIGTGESEPEVIGKLVEQFSVEQIACAFLSLYRAQHSAPEELTSIDAVQRPRREFGPSVWFTLSCGRNQNADPRRLLPMLCKAGGITRDDIGAIRIQPEETFVEIREESAAAFLDRVGADMMVEDGIKLDRLDEPPNLTKDSRGPNPRPARGERPRSGPGHHRRGALEPKVDAPEPSEARKPRHKSGKRTAADPAALRSKSTESSSDASAEPRRKPKGPPPPVGKPSSKKNKARAKASVGKAGKARHGGDARPPRRKK
ncbi:DEAD/DEAH box helicase [Tropicimonas isoalkanivorans]|uniref:ATP-dependent RNA helicase DeaD n=1 Tax=Tropicimonas isoalkanivorans TaxID=441112 RepID=A0A1I1MLW6_9RHOB|nr:DEAD/DEAH box helicase [Tropicimonas isoalkanivorans]SFC86371.1 ATP-dependent RNA helicase DeaD [Tropicimonas isoalkanivorans]